MLSPSSGFRQATPGYGYQFPLDHGTHDAYQTEWWYFTGHLTTESGRRFGYQVTFFRRGLDADTVRTNPSRWALHHLYLAHAALSDLQGDRFHFAEKLSRAGIGKAGADPGRLHVWIDRWSLEATAPDHRRHRLRVAADGFTLELILTAEKPPVIHGQDGISRKSAAGEQASHYYSITRLATEGTVEVQGQRHTVTGLSWMDHEFGSGDLGDGLVGWDWFSIQLDTQQDLMLYLLRHADGTPDPASSGTLVAPDGHPRHLRHDDVSVTVLGHWTSSASGTRYPSGWRLAVPSQDLTLDLHPLLDDQELITARSTQVTYWEGAVRVSGVQRGRTVTGQGYVELTGYAEPFRHVK
ncbi:MAG: lipocalin-like domain-containing protein [Nitrospirales bacterium]